MKISDLFRFSTDNLRRRKGRTALTIIGVVVGVCAIVVMVSLGIAVNQATDAMLQNWEDLTKITVHRNGAKQGTPDLDDKMVEQFRNTEHVIASTPMYTPQSFSGNLLGGKNGRYQAYAQLVGMDPTAIEPMGYSLSVGSFLTGQKLGKDKIPVLLEEQIVFAFSDSKLSANNPNRYKYPIYNEEDMTYIPANLPRFDENGVLLNPEDSFFNPMDPPLILQIDYEYDEATDSYKHMQYELVVVGIISGGSDYDIMNSVIMSIEDVKKIESQYKKLTKTSSGGFSGGGMAVMGGMYGMGDPSGENTIQVGGYDSVFIKVDNVENMPAVEKELKSIGYQFYSMSQTREQMQGQVAQTQMMLGGLAAISLFVAALNIANTMTMAIYERTKEIGVMKVLGCELSDIRKMFLIESGSIGFLGGIIGCALSVLLSVLLNYLPMLLALLNISDAIDIGAIFGMGGITQGGDMKLSVIPVWLIVLALGFATVVGLLSGIAPANRAVKISSLEAIRHE